MFFYIFDLFAFPAWRTVSGCFQSLYSANCLLTVASYSWHGHNISTHLTLDRRSIEHITQNVKLFFKWFLKCSSTGQLSFPKQSNKSTGCSRILVEVFPDRNPVAHGAGGGWWALSVVDHLFTLQGRILPVTVVTTEANVWWMSVSGGLEAVWS